MLPDQSQGNPQQVDPRLLMQLMMARRAQQGSIPGMAAPQGTPSMSTSQQGGVPGAAPGPQATPSSQAMPQNQAQPGPARQLSPASPTPWSGGTFGDRRGIISQIVGAAEKRGHDKKVNEAEMYYNQINSFLASGKPEDQQKAHQLLDDPKVRKILKTGLDYVPLEEDPPPEALGVHQAQQKITQKQSVLQQMKQMLSGGRQQGSAQPRPQGRAVIPGPSQAAQGAYAEQQAKIAEQQALAKQHGQEGNRADVQALAEKQKADAETQKADAETAKVAVEQAKADAEKVKNEGLADEARSHGKLYDQQAKDAEGLSPGKVREANAHSYEMEALARYHDAMAKYAKDGKLPGSKTKDLMKSARDNAMKMLSLAASDNKDAKKDLAKNPWYSSNTRLQKLQDDASKSAKDLAAAIAWYDSEGTEAVNEGKMTPPEAAAEMYRMAGVTPPTPGGGDKGEITVDTPNGPMRFPNQASADSFKKEAGIK